MDRHIGNMNCWAVKYKIPTFLHHHRTLLQTAADLRAELSQTAIEHTKFLADHARRGADILHSVRGE